MRKKEHRELRAEGSELLTGTKFVWLTKPDNWNEKQKATFKNLKQDGLKVGRAWAIKSDPIPESFAVVRQRMGTLKRAGLVKSQKVYSESKSLFLLSDLGWKVLDSRFPDAVFGPPVRVVDFRNYDHDFRVTICRIALEKYKKASSWIPERRIRIEGFEQPNARYRLPDTIIPDAIFTNVMYEARFCFR